MGLDKVRVESKEVVDSSLSKSVTRLGIIPAVPRPFDAGMEAAIGPRLSDILGKEITRNNCISDYESANGIFIVDVEELKLDVIDHLESVFRMVRRGRYPATVLPSYGVSATIMVLPDMTTPAEVKTAAGNVAVGNAKVILLGKTPLADFPASAIATKLADLIPVETLNNSTEGLMNGAETTLTISVNLGKALVEDNRPQMDFNYRSEEHTSQL